MRMTYTGTCHCQTVRFEITADIDHVRDCDCSICQKRGALVFRVPATDFKMWSDWQDLSVYQWGSFTAKDYFCKTCGVMPFRRPSDLTQEEIRQGKIPFEGWAVNTACLTELDVSGLPIRKVNGSQLSLP